MVYIDTTSGQSLQVFFPSLPPPFSLPLSLSLPLLPLRFEPEAPMSLYQRATMGCTVRPIMATLLPSLRGTVLEVTHTGCGGTRWRSYHRSMMELMTMKVSIQQWWMKLCEEY